MTLGSLVIIFIISGLRERLRQGGARGQTHERQRQLQRPGNQDRHPPDPKGEIRERRFHWFERLCYRTSSKERKERSRGTKAEDLKRLVNNYSWDWVWIYWYITFLLFLLIITGIIQASLRLWTERRIERVLGQQNICSPSDVSKCQAQDVDLITLVTRMRSFVFCLQITKLQP